MAKLNKPEIEKLINELGPFEKKVAQLVVDPAFRIVSEVLLGKGFTADQVYHAYNLLKNKKENGAHGN